MNSVGLCWDSRWGKRGGGKPQEAQDEPWRGSPRPRRRFQLSKATAFPCRTRCFLDSSCAQSIFREEIDYLRARGTNNIFFKNLRKYLINCTYVYWCMIALNLNLVPSANEKFYVRKQNINCLLFLQITTVYGRNQNISKVAVYLGAVPSISFKTMNCPFALSLFLPVCNTVVPPKLSSCAKAPRCDPSLIVRTETATQVKAAGP